MDYLTNKKSKKTINYLTNSFNKISSIQNLMLFGLIAIMITTFSVNVFGAGVVFSDSFDTGDISSQWRRECASVESCQVSDSVAKDGTSSIKFSLQKGDPDVALSKRAEIAYKKEEAFQDFEYGFSIFLPANYQQDRSGEILAQWHENPDFDLGENWKSPPLALYTDDGEWVLRQFWDLDLISLSQNGSNAGSSRTSLGNYQTGVWTDWKFRVKWSVEGDGIVEVYQNNVKLFDKKGINTYNNKEGIYFKTGIYKFDWKNRPDYSQIDSREIFVDKISITQLLVAQNITPNPTTPTAPTPSQANNNSKVATDFYKKPLLRTGGEADIQTMIISSAIFALSVLAGFSILVKSKNSNISKK